MRHLCVILLAVLVAVPMSCAGRTKRPNVLLVVIDTLRADRLGAYGNRRGLTPFIDGLASRGTVFRNAYANSSWTIPSVASLFTSRYPSQHGTVSHNFTLSEVEVTLAEKLQAAGYAGAGYSANPGLQVERGFAQGFQIWSPFVAAGGKVRGERLRKLVARRLYTTRDAMPAPPSFFFLQYMEPHAPYLAPSFVRGIAPVASAALHEAHTKLRSLNWEGLSDEDVDLLRSAYDAEVAAVDGELEILFDQLTRERFLENAIVLITADHGEEFREHGGMSHGTALYDETVRVPFILIVPGYEGGLQVDATVSLVDVAPTILDLLDLPREPAFEGRSLVPMLTRRLPWWRRFFVAALGAIESPAPDARAVDVLLELPWFSATPDRRRHEAGIVHGTRKLLLSPNGRTEVYDTADDPGEKAPNPPALAAAQAELTRALGRTLRRSREGASASAVRVPLDEATKERLRELGYDGF